MRQILAGICLLSLTGVLFAQEKKAVNNDFLKPVMTSDLITLQPLKEFESFEITVRGADGVVYVQQVNGMHNPFIETYDLDGNYLPDGRYAYEVRATPLLSMDQRQMIRNARESGDVGAIQALRASGQLPRGEQPQSGYFSIVDGFFVMPEVEVTSRIAAKTDSSGREDGARPGAPTGGSEGAGTGDRGDDDTDLNNRDQLILDDLIVDGSACIGFDCVNGESFGFDTIRLKENNLRIKFDDTSVGSFPSTDWQLTANDSASGGANKFSIDDISGGRTPFTVEGNAPSHSLYVDDGGRVGFGTSIPVVDLHVKSGNTPTLRLEQDGTSGFAPQTWDVAGNETNFFIRDASNGSTLPFRIRPGADSSSIFIDTDSDVGLSTASPDAQLHVVGDGVLISDVDSGAQADQRPLHVVGEDGSAFIHRNSSTPSNTFDIMQMVNNGRVFLRLEDTSQSKTWFFGTQSQDFFINDAGDGDTELRLFANGNMTINGTLTELSDKNAKENITSIKPVDVLSKVLDLPLSTWNYIDSEETHLGPMAQDFHAAFGLNGSDVGITSIDTSGVALGAIQGLHQVIETKDARINELEKKLADQDARLKALEAALLK
jgi:hypothetical protein